MPDHPLLVAVDIGNSRIKLGWFEKSLTSDALPKPIGELTLPAEAWDESLIARTLPWEALGGRWCVASVNRPATKRLITWLNSTVPHKRPSDVRELSHHDLPLAVRVAEPDRVGIDRLLGAVAANRLRDPELPAIVIDLGSAMTFDLVAADGAFLGGAILPGVGMSARRFTTLPISCRRFPMDELAEPPPALGTSTVEAMRSGLYWGAVGAMRELVVRLREALATDEPTTTGLSHRRRRPRSRTVPPGRRHVRSSPGARRHCQRRRRMSEHSEPTVAAILTPTGRGAIASIAIDGPQAAAMVAQLFVPAVSRPFIERPQGDIVYGRWSSSNEDVVACRRNTDRVEIHCHGGVAASRAILDSLVAAGCIAVSWQDFVARDERDRIRAAARVALAECRTQRSAAILLDQYRGALAHAIREIDSVLEHRQTTAAVQSLELLLSRSRLGLHLASPWQVVIAGPPNVGKSSLINALVGYERAIVFDQPGTTRDVVTALTAFDGWPVELSDTAGLRESRDPLELAGVAKAQQQLQQADLILLVFDRLQPWTRRPTSARRSMARRTRCPQQARSVFGSVVQRLSNSAAAWHRCKRLDRPTAV